MSNMVIFAILVAKILHTYLIFTFPLIAVTRQPCLCYELFVAVFLSSTHVHHFSTRLLVVSRSVVSKSLRTCGL